MSIEIPTFEDVYKMIHLVNHGWKLEDGTWSKEGIQEQWYDMMEDKPTFHTRFQLVEAWRKQMIEEIPDEKERMMKRQREMERNW